MRNFTTQELRDDISSLKYHIIYGHVADRLSQNFHFDDFFAPQMKFWSQLTVAQQHEYLDKLSYNLKINLKTMTFAEFFSRMSSHIAAPKFTTFNVNMMNILLRKYEPKSVFDPCAGWGQRMLMCESYGIEYTGVDIRKDSILQNQALSKFAFPDFNKVVLACDDGANVQYLTKNQNIDMMFTCPPYFDDEIYSDKGAENKTAADFKVWWKQIIVNCKASNIKYVAFQITPDYGEQLKLITEQSGYHYIESIMNTRHHTSQMHINTKGQYARRKYGQIYVFEINK